MISFITPTKNEEKIIEKTLLCLSKYNGEKEIIVSDGKSTDNTIEIAKRYGKVIEYTETKRQTIGAGRNAGAKIAQGDLLMFLDADMHIPNINDFFNKAENLFKTDNKLVALTVALRVLPEFETRADKIIFSFINKLYYLENNILGIGAASGEFQMIRNEAFKKIGGYNENLPVAEDHALFQNIRKIGKTRFEGSLTAYHTGRRAHKIGWPKLLYQWIMNYFFVFIFKKPFSEEWKVIR